MYCTHTRQDTATGSSLTRIFLPPDDGQTQSLSTTTPQSSPINSIPVEILTDIFDFCQPQGDWREPSVPTLEHIVAVCSHWRAVALSAPYLWSKIRLRDPLTPYIPLVQRWLELSQRCPLDITIRQSSKLDISGLPLKWMRIGEATSTLLNLLLPHLHRWKSLELSLCQPTPFPRLPLSSEAAPILKHVDIRDSQMLTPDARRLWQMILSSPSMRRISWKADMPQTAFLPGLIDFDWEKLTHITGDFVVDDTFLDILSQCTSLEYFDISRGSRDPTEWTPEPRLGAPFVLPALQVLRFHTDEVSLLDHLILPLLKQVVLYRYEARLYKWVDLFRRSSCTLVSVSFSVHSNKVSGVDVVAFLSSSAMSTVTFLHASAAGNSSFLIKILTRRSGRELLPSLRTLSLGLQNCEDGLLEAMVKSWTADSDSPLKTIRIVHTLYPHRVLQQCGPEVSFFERLRQTGFDIEYDGPPVQN
ncbi:hypothetical protein Moror_17047 [Moniliophthora roreri MCA 2997]|uniref:F-box domain-containing protein n=2 Tax=Moniliophthora roreri TaxID=221103 RepID=V2X8R1_MONRO|nr:hypothetical protein Moror_17047 [Moniliophthora roreri MCA 2997]KAI3605451.1 hypothetical protein WG66_005963 [Moniliophthora roreri]